MTPEERQLHLEMEDGLSRYIDVDSQTYAQHYSAMCTSPAPDGWCLPAQRNTSVNNFEPLEGPISIGFPPVLADRRLYGLVVDNDNLDYTYHLRVPHGEEEVYNVSVVYRIEQENDFRVFDVSQDAYVPVIAGACHACLKLDTCPMHGTDKITGTHDTKEKGDMPNKKQKREG